MYTLRTQEPLRLDRFLSQSLELSKRETLILLNAKLVEHLFSGLILPEPTASLDILTQGEGYIVIDKASGMPVMPLRADETGTVLNAVVARHSELQGVGEGGLRSGVVHRLDTDTSGTLIVATQEDAWQQLRHAFKTHNTIKRYRTLVKGRLTGEGHENLDLYVAQHKPAKVRVATKLKKGSRLWLSLLTKGILSLVTSSTGTMSSSYPDKCSTQHSSKF